MEERTAVKMKMRLLKDVGSTRLRRVQFGVPPNCIGARAMGVDRTNNGALPPRKVSGATPETTRGTRVLHKLISNAPLMKDNDGLA
jgi:hypothetical protein